MRPAISPIQSISVQGCLDRCRDSNTIIQLEQTGTLQNYAHYECDEGLECLGVFLPTVPSTCLFRCSRKQGLLTRSTSI